MQYWKWAREFLISHFDHIFNSNQDQIQIYRAAPIIPYFFKKKKIKKNRDTEFGHLCSVCLTGATSMNWDCRLTISAKDSAQLWEMRRPRFITIQIPQLCSIHESGNHRFFSHSYPSHSTGNWHPRELPSTFPGKTCETHFLWNGIDSSSFWWIVRVV